MAPRPIPGDTDSREFNIEEFENMRLAEEAEANKNNFNFDPRQQPEPIQQSIVPKPGGDDFSFNDVMPKEEPRILAPQRPKGTILKTLKEKLLSKNGVPQKSKPSVSSPPIKPGELPAPNIGYVEEKKKEEPDIKYWGKAPKYSESVDPMTFETLTNEDLQAMFRGAIQANKPDKKQLIVDTMSRLDLSPLWNWMDNTFGTNYLKGYKPPGSVNEVLKRMQDAREAGVDEFKARFVARKQIEDLKYDIVKNENQLKQAMEIAKMDQAGALERARVNAAGAVRAAEKQNVHEQKNELVVGDLSNIMANIHDLITTDPSISLNPLDVAKAAVGEYFPSTGWGGSASLKKHIADLNEALAPERLGSTRTFHEMRALKNWVGMRFNSPKSFKRDYIDFARKMNNLYKAYNLDTKTNLKMPFDPKEIKESEELLKSNGG